MKPIYTAHYAIVPPALDGNWNAPVWQAAETLAVAHFHPQGSDHQPVTLARVLHSDAALHVLFRVEDRYVRCANKGLHSAVYKDSCVEFFVQPKVDRGYMNFEINCGGSLLNYFIEDPTRTPDGFKKFRPVDPAVDALVKIAHSMPERVEPEREGAAVWTIECAVPWEVFEAHVGPVRPVTGTEWQANFFKCGDETSHPHWGSWSPIGEALNFHQPQFFGTLRFAP